MLMPLQRLIQRLPAWFEFLTVCALCWGVFAVKSFMLAAGQIQLPALSTDVMLNLIGRELTLAVLAIVFLKCRGWSFKDLPIHISWTNSAVSLLLVLISFLLYWIAFDIGRALGGDVDTLRLMAQSVSVALPVALIGSIVNGAFEELFLVGYVFKALERHGISFVLGVSVFLRMFAHIYQGPVGALAVLVFGVFLGLVYWRFKQLWPLMLAHMTIDFLSLVR